MKLNTSIKKKEISSVLIEITDGLSNHVEVSGIYEASINLTHTEKVVETSLESLRTTGELVFLFFFITLYIFPILSWIN